MQLSRHSKIVSGLLLIAVPSIMYGGFTLLGLLTSGAAGIAPASLSLSDQQYALWRAGHAHAGVLVIFSIVLQPLVDQTTFSIRKQWLARLGAPLASILLPIGFFGLAFNPIFKGFILTGAFCLFASMIMTGIGLLRK